MHPPACPPAHLAWREKATLPLCVIDKDRLAPVVAIQDVRYRSREFDEPARTCPHCGPFKLVLRRRLETSPTVTNPAVIDTS